MTEFARNDLGRYITKGLDEKAFARVAKRIAQDQRRNRRGAKRLITPSLLKTRDINKLLKLGRKKKDGLFFTLEDLAALRQNKASHEKKYNRSIAGITYAELVSGSLSIDVARANNTVSDGRGITNARLINIKNNVLLVRVKASSVSVHQDHAVRIRLEEWDAQMDACPDTVQGYAKATKAACAGRASFDCDCGRHQFWYRHLATVGNYALAPPKEPSPPKIKNPKYEGIACKHVIKAMTMLQAASWQGILSRQMKKQAESGLPTDDHKAHYITGDEAKEAARNRKTKTNKSRIQREHERYVARQEALDKKMKANKETVDDARKQLKRARKQTKAEQARALAAEKVAKKKAAENEKLKGQMAVMVSKFRDMHIATAMSTGQTRAQAEQSFKAFAKSQGWVTDDL